MFKTVKPGALIFALTVLLFASSCMPKNDITERTPEMEAEELRQIIEKIESDTFDVDTTALGIYYVMHDEGVDSLPLVQPGDSCFLEYTGLLPDGTVFDDSKYHYNDGIWKFVYKETDFIPGFDDGIALMRKGTKIDLIIPSELAYGATGQGPIPPYTTLIFTTYMHDVKPVLQP